MARITVDDCLENIPNRFELTLVAAYRARQLANGSELLVQSGSNKDKPTVLALREIAAGKIGADLLTKSNAPAAAVVEEAPVETVTETPEAPAA